MKVQVFYPNKDGKIEFTKKELEKLLQEVYDDGHADGYQAGKNDHYTWWPNTIATPYYGTATDKTIDITPNITWSTTSNNSGDTCYDIHLTTTSSSENTAYINNANN